MDSGRLKKMSNFSQKHYEAIACVFRNFPGRDLHTTRDIEVLILVIDQLAAMFRADNEKFKDEKFIKACGNWQEK